MNSVKFCFLTMCCSLERWSILEGNVAPCARRNTQKPPHSDCRPKPSPLKNTNVTTTTDSGAGRGRGEGGKRVDTGTRAAVHTVFLADFLDVETMAGSRAGLGAFTVLHPNWTLGDWGQHRYKHIIRKSL